MGSRKRGPPREVSASPSRSLSVGWKRGSARSNLPLGRVGSSCGAGLFFEAQGRGSPRLKNKAYDSGVGVFVPEKNSRGRTATTARSGQKNAFVRRVVCKAGVGCPRSNRY